MRKVSTRKEPDPPGIGPDTLVDFDEGAETNEEVRGSHSSRVRGVQDEVNGVGVCTAWRAWHAATDADTNANPNPKPNPLP